MRNDEQAIRELAGRWLSASEAGDIETVLELMSNDVIFMVPRREPFGKAAFVAGMEAMKGVRMEGTSRILEIEIVGEWAWMRSHLKVTTTPPNGKRVVRSGYTLTILRKNGNGKWVLVRDANLLTPDDNP